MIKEGESFVYPNAFAPLLSFTQQRACVPQNARLSHQPPLVGAQFVRESSLREQLKGPLR